MSGGVLGLIAGNVSSAGGVLTEEDFFAAMGVAFSQPSRPAAVVTSPRVIEAGKAAGRVWRRRAEDADRRLFRLSRGWRRVRLLARLRALQDYRVAIRARDSFEGTFGR